MSDTLLVMCIECNKMQKATKAEYAKGFVTCFDCYAKDQPNE